MFQQTKHIDVKNLIWRGKLIPLQLPNTQLVLHPQKIIIYQWEWVGIRKGKIVPGNDEKQNNWVNHSYAPNVKLVLVMQKIGGWNTEEDMLNSFSNLLCGYIIKKISRIISKCSSFFRFFLNIFLGKKYLNVTVAFLTQSEKLYTSRNLTNWHFSQKF